MGCFLFQCLSKKNLSIQVAYKLKTNKQTKKQPYPTFKHCFLSFLLSFLDYQGPAGSMFIFRHEWLCYSTGRCLFHPSVSITPHHPFSLVSPLSPNPEPPGCIVPQNQIKYLLLDCAEEPIGCASGEEGTWNLISYLCCQPIPVSSSPTPHLQS